MECEVFMGEEDIRRQALNVFKMELLGAKVIPVTSGTGTLKDAVSEAIRYWVTNVTDTFYVIGSVVGPHPYPTMVRDFQKIIGEETKKQIMEKEGRLPDYVLACVGGGSNAMGMFYPFIEDKDVKLIGVEAGGRGIETGQHAASIQGGSEGVIHGTMTYVMQNDEGQLLNAYSISAGLDYPGIGPEHAYLSESGRATYEVINDDEAMEALKLASQVEGIIPAIESSHAIAYGCKLAKKLVHELGKDKASEKIIVINISGRGDKDMDTIRSYFGGKDHE